VYSNTFTIAGGDLEFPIPQPLPASARFHLEWDLGPSGGWDVIEGDLDAPQFRYGYTNLMDANFALHLPLWMGEMAVPLLRRFEDAYGYWTQLVGQRPPAWGAGTNFYVNLVGNHAGWGGEEAWYKGFTIWDPADPAGGYFEALAFHELGHRLLGDLFWPSGWNFSNSGCLRNEAMASLLAIDALAALHGQKYATIWSVPGATFFNNLANGITNDPNNLHFIVQEYLPQRFGGGITAQFFRSWLRACSTLYPQGFNEAETFTALYSTLAGTNLTWLFRLDGSTLDEQRVAIAMTELDAQGAIRPSLSLRCTGGKPCLELLGQVGREYSILTSTNLGQWLEWTNVTCTNLPVNVVDPDACNSPARFYRAFRQ
jgi:hypothetical protein